MARERSHFVMVNTSIQQDGGAYIKHRFAVIVLVVLLGLNTGTIDLPENGWGQQVGLPGKKQNIFIEEGSKKVQWKRVAGEGPPVSWYKARFATPEGRDPVAIMMTGMGKGQVWINWNSIGRYWMSFLSPLKQASQSEYQIPRAFLNEKDNLLVVFEKENRNPEKVEILIVDRDTICSYIIDVHPPHVKQFASKKMKLHAIVGDVKTEATLKCANSKKVTAVEFASFGDPTGSCAFYERGTCDSPADGPFIIPYLLQTLPTRQAPGSRYSVEV